MPIVEEYQKVLKMILAYKSATALIPRDVEFSRWIPDFLRLCQTMPWDVERSLAAGAWYLGNQIQVAVKRRPAALTSSSRSSRRTSAPPVFTLVLSCGQCLCLGFEQTCSYARVIYGLARWRSSLWTLNAELKTVMQLSGTRLLKINTSNSSQPIQFNLPSWPSWLKIIDKRFAPLDGGLFFSCYRLGNKSPLKFI